MIHVDSHVDLNVQIGRREGEGERGKNSVRPEVGL